MASKNSETPQCANTNGASMSVISEKTNMIIVAKSDFNFQGNALAPVPGITGVWLTSADIAKALQYKSAKSITNLFNQNSDEFTSGMTQVIESVTSGNYRKKVRIFSLRGAHLIAMFARTAVAKEFRRWVLDILDKQCANKVLITNEPSEREVAAYNVQVLMSHYQAMYEAWKFQIYPALKAVESPLAGRLYDRFSDGNMFLNAVNRAAQKKLLPGELARIF
ncbi:Bro-N domain-containing protein [Serratia liquefaciens]|uniref:BRO-N domain-containing protein n=1 Tax=Serratia liquefaciens TaxID=614 RepID=UPI0021841339|nr:Bro-N domain-containing protein [Serratia liquefaciens]CAI2468981.1 BRO family, N-terminal domain [Serratia liquefaciens]